jgi:hypothetical protein
MKARNDIAVMAQRAATADWDPDFFPTWPWGFRAGAELVKRFDPMAEIVWENACGHGSGAHGLRDYFPSVICSDLVDYGYGQVHDFLSDAPAPVAAPEWIITNPPFRHAPEFVTRSLNVATRGVAMFLPTRALEGIARYRLLYEIAPFHILAPFSERIPLHKGRLVKKGRTATFYSWFIWLQTRKPRGYAPILVPIPPGTRKRLSRASDLQFTDEGGG